jgi:hypothetical protein
MCEALAHSPIKHQMHSNPRGRFAVAATHAPAPGEEGRDVTHPGGPTGCAPAPAVPQNTKTEHTTHATTPTRAPAHTHAHTSAAGLACAVARPRKTATRANGDIKDHFFFIKSQGDKRRAQRLALAREAPGPPKGH